MPITRSLEKGESWSVNVLAGATTEVMGYEVPSRVRLRYRRVGNYLSVVAAWGLVTWQVLKNGIVVQTIRDQIGYAAQRELITPTVVQPGDRVSVNAVNAHVAAVDVGVTFTWDEESLE